MRWFLSFLADILKIFYASSKCKILGCRVEIRGRLQRKDRRNRLKRSFQQGSLPLQKLTAPIVLHSTYAFTKNGLVNIKVWIHY
jgi:ribosomal protein S3